MHCLRWAKLPVLLSLPDGQLLYLLRRQVGPAGEAVRMRNPDANWEQRGPVLTRTKLRMVGKECDRAFHAARWFRKVTSR